MERRELTCVNLLKSLAGASSLTMVSRILGLVREVINSHQFGANAAMDAFVVAFRLPNLFRRVFAEGAFSQAFVPLLAEYRTQQGEERARAFVAEVAGFLTFVLLIFTVVGVIFAPWMVFLFASGFENTPGKTELTTALTRITFPYILLISLSSMASSILNTWNRFAVPAFTPALLNVSMILCGLYLSPYFAEPIYALAISVAIGGVLQLGFQLPYLAKINMLPLPRLHFGDPGVRRVMLLMGPAIFGVSVQQVSLLLNTIFASWLPDGSLSWMNYADRLMELPAGVLGVALGTILLPSLSRLRSAGDDDGYSGMLDWGLRLCLLLVIPAAVAMAMIAQPIIATLFMSGKFTAFDVEMTARSLVGYSVGLVPLIAIKILAPAYYAKQDVVTPVKIGIVTLVITQLLNLVLIGPLAHAGLALALSLGACFNAAMLFTGLLRSGTYRPEVGWAGFIGKLLLAVTLMAGVLYLSTLYSGNYLQQGRLASILQLTLTITAGAFIYFGALFAMGFRPRDFSRRAV
jgi:putative peptidoglycan lipid II flippase